MLSKFLPFIFICIPLISLGHPSNTLHQHNENNIEIEGDGTKDGSTWHNHMMFLSYANQVPVHEPFTVLGCWDNQEYRFDDLGSIFQEAHCYVNNWASSETVAYSFVGPWPSSAKNLVRDVVDQFNNLGTPVTTTVPHGKTGYSIGFEFSEVSGSADVEFVWGTTPLPGQVVALWVPTESVYSTSSTHQLFFDPMPASDFPGWDYAASSSEEDDTKFHFMSVALHEIGHVVGFAHQADTDDVMQAGTSGFYNPALGTGPYGHAGRNPFYELDNDTSVGVFNIYGQPPSPPPPSCDVSVSFLGCNFGGNGNFQVTASLPGYEVTSADYDLSIGGGPWWDIFEGPLTCPTFNLGLTALIRVILQTQYGTSQCTTTVYIPPFFCDENGDPQ